MSSQDKGRMADEPYQRVLIVDILQGLTPRKARFGDVRSHRVIFR